MKTKHFHQFCDDFHITFTPGIFEGWIITIGENIVSTFLILSSVSNVSCKHCWKRLQYFLLSNVPLSLDKKACLLFSMQLKRQIASECFLHIFAFYVIMFHDIALSKILLLLDLLIYLKLSILLTSYVEWCIIFNLNLIVII